MGRIIVLTTLAAVASAALIYGVVLNGFGLLGPAAPPPIASVATRTAPPVDATAPAGPAESNLQQAAAPKTDRADTAAGTDATGTPAPAEPPRVARDVTPPNVLSRPTSRYRDPALEEKQNAETEQPLVRRYHRVVVEDAGTLKSGDVTIHFAGIAPIEGKRTCTDDHGQSWPCGRVAAAALRMLIRNRAVDCTVVSEAADGILGTCSAGLQDINGWLVDQGWADPAPDAGYAAEADAARSSKRGIYLARWEQTGQGGAGAVPQAAFVAPPIRPDAFSVVPVEQPAQGPVN